MSAERAGPNGEPGSKPSGAGAPMRFWQQEQMPRWRLDHRGDTCCLSALRPRIWPRRPAGDPCLRPHRPAAAAPHPVGVFGQRAGDARTAATGLLRTVGGVRLLTLRGRDARVVRRLCWSREPAFQFRNTCRQDADLLSLRLDLRLLCLHQGDQVTVRKGEKGGAVHPSPVGDSAVTVSSRILPEGGE